MSAARVDLLVNLVGFAGVLLLAWPALYAAKLARLASRLQNLPPVDTTARAQEIHNSARKKVEDLRAGWSAGLNFSLLAGTGLTALSYLIGILKFFLAN